MLRRLLFIACIPAAAAQMGGLPAGMTMDGAGGADEVETHNAEELDNETFDERLAEYELVLVLFREAGGQSQQTDKEFELAATELAISDEAIFVGLVDLTSDKAKGAAKKAKVTKGPTAKCYRRGKPLDLGPPGFDARSLVNFMRYLSAPVSKILPNTTAINEYLRDARETVVLGIFADRNRPTHNVWMKNAEALRPPFRFVEASVEAANGAKLFGAVTLDEAKNQFAVVPPSKWVAKSESPYFLSSDFKGMQDFVNAHALTRVAPLTSYAHRRYRSMGRPLVALSFDQGKLGKMFKYFVNRLHKLFEAEPELTERFVFTIFDKHAATSMADDFGVPKDKDFVVSITRLDSHDKWGTDLLTNMTADSFSALPLIPFLKRIDAGEEPTFVKSEEPPAEPPSPGKPVKVVAKTSASLLDDEAMDVLLALYGSKAPGDELAHLAAVFAEVPTVRVAQMNGTANAFNFTRFRVGSEEASYFMLPASAKGKAAPIPLDSKKSELLDLAELLLKHMVSSDTDKLPTIRKRIKQMRKAKDAELEEQARQMGLPPNPDKMKRRKKRKRKSKSKDEL